MASRPESTLHGVDGVQGDAAAPLPSCTNQSNFRGRVGVVEGTCDASVMCLVLGPLYSWTLVMRRFSLGGTPPIGPAAALILATAVLVRAALASESPPARRPRAAGTGGRASRVTLRLSDGHSAVTGY